MPQVLAPMSVHWLNGSVPAAMDAHVPTVPVSAHDRQIPTQAVAQQTPCSQNPELHSPAAPHVAPIGFLPQLPPVQTLGATQSLSVVQVTRHAPEAPQT